MIKTRLIKLLSHSKKYIVYNVLWQWVALLSQIVVVFTISNMIEKLYYQQLVQNDIIFSLVILIVMMIIRIISDKMASQASYNASVDVKRVLREKIYEKVLRLQASYKEQVATSEIVQVSSEGVEQLETYFGRYLPQLFYSLLAPLTLFIVLMFISLKASIVLLICVPLIPISIVVVQKIAKRLLNKYWSLYTNLGDSFLENLQGLTTLKIYQADAKKALDMDEEAQNFRKITMKVLTMQLNSTSIMDIIAYGGAAVGIITAILQYTNGSLSLSGALRIILLASEFFIPLRLLGSYFHIAMNGMAASDKIFKILDLPEPVFGKERIDDASIDIHLSHVCFSYEKDREILKDINLNLDNGSFISLVGESGCGKSTIAKILTGKLRNYQGDICLNDVLLKDVDPTNLNNQITIVKHNSYLFKGTIRDNLLMAKNDATDLEMYDVLKQVNLKDFVDEQDGLDTLISEKGSNLSGGQCQRLALARALLHDTPVYIFDEATSNIDVESEDMIMKVIHSLAKTKTILLISHRLSNVVYSDKIYMLDKGQIIEEGTHQQLMELDGSYRHLFDSQKKLENYMGGQTI